MAGVHNDGVYVGGLERAGGAYREHAGVRGGRGGGDIMTGRGHEQRVVLVLELRLGQ